MSSKSAAKSAAKSGARSGTGNRRPKTALSEKARQQITRIVEGWFVTEPLLFAAWTTHDVIERPQIQTIRVGRSKVEFNPEFIASLKLSDLRSVLSFEAMRILLGHPYSRKQQSAELSYLASNITVQEYLRTNLDVPRPRDLFGDESYDNQFFERYYQELMGRSKSDPTDPNQENDEAEDDSSGDDAGDPSQNGDDQEDQNSEDQNDECQTDEDSAEEGSEGDSASGNDLSTYTIPEAAAAQNTANWDEDDLQRDEIEGLIREAEASDGWGTLSQSAREQLIANLIPKLDYRSVLSRFRQTVLSTNRRLTRMKPSRRYGFDQMGSRYDFTTRLLFAVDVSGSVSREDMSMAFSIVNRFFRYGIEAIDVVAFDSIIQGQVETLKRARQSFDVTGRGGTNFACIVELAQDSNHYDGVIIYTDGQAPVPSMNPQKPMPPLMWLLKDESCYQRFGEGLKRTGMIAFVR